MNTIAGRGGKKDFRDFTAHRDIFTAEDIRDISRISDIKGIEQVIELLPSKVGSLPSINSIIGYHHATINSWLEMLKAIYLLFTLRPWHKTLSCDKFPDALGIDH